MTADVDPFDVKGMVEGMEAPFAQGRAADAGEEPDPDWQPL